MWRTPVLSANLNSGDGQGDKGSEEEGKPDPEDRIKKWRWYSCICHRDAPVSSGEKVVNSGGERRVTPAYLDRCLVGEGACAVWPGEAPGKCRVGGMGYLLCCKRG